MRFAPLLTVLFAIACGSGDPGFNPSSVGAPPPVPVEPADLPPATATGPGVGLCEHDERPRFSCPVDEGKTASLCQRGSAMTYRFGKRGAVELTVTRADGSPGAWEVSQVPQGGDGERFIASAWNNEYRYAVNIDRTEDVFDGQVIVRKHGKKIVELPCRGDVSGDLTELQGTFQGDPMAFEAWVGDWSGGAGSFEIRHHKGVFTLENGEALWHGSNPGQVHTGEASGTLDREAPDRMKLESDGCEITLVRTGPDAMDVDDNLRCGGMNVTFMGSYVRAP